MWEPRPHSSSSFQRFSFQNSSFYLLPTLSDKLETREYSGLDIRGLLKSASCSIPEGHGRPARHLLPASPEFMLSRILHKSLSSLLAHTI